MAEPRFNVERPTIEGLNDPPHFSNAVVTEGGKMVHLSGQLSPEGDLAAQFKGVYDKLKIGLAACGASPSDVIRQRVFVVDLVPEHRELWSPRWANFMAARNRRAPWSAFRP